jgi:hypothetical protein
MALVRSAADQGTGDRPDNIKRRAIRFSAPYLLLSVLGFAQGRAGNVFVIASRLGTAAVGDYSFVFVVMQFGTFLNPIYVLNTLINNVIVRRSVHVDQRELLARGQYFFLTLAMYTAVPVAVYLTVIRLPLSQLFGFEQAGTGFLFMWAGIAFVSKSVTLAYGNIFTQLEVPYYRLVFGAIGAVGVGVAFVVAGEYGIEGVAAVTASFSTIGLLVQHLLSKWILKVPVGIYPITLFKIGIINALAGIAAASTLNVSDRFVLIALSSSLAFVSVYGATTLVLRPFSSDHIKLARSIFPNLKLPALGAKLRWKNFRK